MSLITVEEYINFPVVPADVRLTYGTDENHFIDLFLPEAASDKRPVILLIHGGCWRAQYGLGQMGHFARTMSQHGIVVANIEYRRIGNGGGWPNTFLDVGAAADFLKTIATEYKLDLTNITAVGHSAGGHLVLWTAIRDQINPLSVLHTANPLPIKAVVSLAGVADLVEGDAREICQSAIAELMDGKPADVAENYLAGSPRNYLPLGKPHTHIVGEHDMIVPADYISQYVQAAQATGDAATLIVEPDAAHFEIVAPISAAWPTVEREILKLIR